MCKPCIFKTEQTKYLNLDSNIHFIVPNFKNSGFVDLGLMPKGTSTVLSGHMMSFPFKYSNTTCHHKSQCNIYIYIYSFNP
jgi:hypothetical protein